MILGTGLQLAHGAWQPRPLATPDTDPNTGNVSGPLTTGSGQTKDGPLTVNASPSIDTTVPADGVPDAYAETGLLVANGKVGASEYCDVRGENCFTPPFGGGGGGEGWVIEYRSEAAGGVVGRFNDTEPFDAACQYRVRVRNSDGNPSSAFFYAYTVAPTRLFIETSTSGVTKSIIPYDQKRYFDYVQDGDVATLVQNNVAVIEQIDKLCNGGGSAVYGGVSANNSGRIAGGWIQRTCVNDSRYTWTTLEWGNFNKTKVTEANWWESVTSCTEGTRRVVSVSDDHLTSGESGFGACADNYVHSEGILCITE